MPSSRSLPVLRGDAHLRAEAQDLVLTRDHVELRIPFAAVASVRADGRAVAITLTAPPGADPAVHHVRDVGEANASLFARDLTASLPEVPGDTDGSAMVITTLLPPKARRWRIPLFAAVCTVAVPALTVPAIAAGQPELLVLTLPLGLCGLFLLLAAVAMWGKAGERVRLRRHGVAVEAVRPPSEEADYLFADAGGGLRVFHGRSEWPDAIGIVYDPRDPSRSTLAAKGFWALLIGGVPVFAVAAYLLAGVASASVSLLEDSGLF